MFFLKKLPIHSAASSIKGNLNFFEIFNSLSILAGCPNTWTTTKAEIFLPVFLL